MYKTICTINGKFYVGKHKTNDLEDGYLGSGKLIKRAIKKYGRENFKREILQFCETEAEMNTLERKHVVLCKESYNLCPGGEGGFGYINDNRLQVTEKQKESARKHIANVRLTVEELGTEHFKRMSINAHIAQKKLYPNGTFFGKTHTKEVRKSIGSKARERLSGTRWVTNDECSKQVSYDEVDKYLSLGYRLGKKRNHGRLSTL